MKRFALFLLVLGLAGCAGEGGFGLRPGEAGEADVVRRLGSPALRWPEPGGGQRLAYPTGPAGFHTWMAVLGPDGRLLSLENVLETGHFARIQPGQSQDQVLRILGPAWPGWTVYFERRDELVWEWRYCDDWSRPARFHVLFDGSSGRVRSTLTLTEDLILPDDFSRRGRWCSR